MNSVYVLILETELDGDQLISAHPTEQIAKSAQRFYRSYEDSFDKTCMDTHIEEVDFGS